MSLYTSGAIDLAAKSAGIIPGSPCRELEGPAPESSLMGADDTPPPVPAAPEPELLQQEQEVSEGEITLFLLQSYNCYDNLYPGYICSLFVCVNNNEHSVCLVFFPALLGFLAKRCFSTISRRR